MCRIALLLQLLALPALVQAQQPIEAASPAELSDTLRGGTPPAVAVPFGFNQWTPGNQGFAPSLDAPLQISPSLGDVVWAAEERGAGFTRTREVAKPHYYRADLASGIRMEITPTLHAAAIRITYPARAPRHLLFHVLDKASGDTKADVAQGSVSGEISARGPKLYFFAKVDAPLERVTSASDGRASVAVSFSKSAPRTVTLRLGTSYVSAEQARLYVEQEVANLSFDALKEQARVHWDNLLGRITVEGAPDSQKVTFYSSLHRALLYPSTLTEHVEGADKHFSPYSNSVRPGASYVNNSFRAAWPLHFLLMPQQAGNMLEGLVNAYRDGGWLPRGNAPGDRDGAIGTHAAVLFADAYAKGIRNFDVHTAFTGMLKDALVVPSRDTVGRAGLARGAFRSYIPHEDIPGSAAWHFANCSDDYSISQLARALGDETHAEYFRLRSLHYATLFAPQVGFFRGRLADGSFRTPDDKFRPEERGFEFANGNANHYVAPAQHDPGGMAGLYGGAKPLAAKLDAVLSASAEPHLVYLYDYAGQPWQTQKYVRKVLAQSEPGPLSPWYVFSALGFYPARIGQSNYAIGSPLFGRSKLALANGKSFEIVAHDNSDTHIYIQRAMLNGQPLESPYLTHAEIANGGTLELYMGDKPSLWGSAAMAAPELSGSDAMKQGLLNDCAQGGTVSASLEYRDAGEVASAAFDDDSRTKWLATEASAWLRYQAKSACAARFYTLTSADDEPARDPKEWALEGSNDGETWAVLDERHNEDFAFRHQTRVFALQKPGPFQSYRLRVTANHGDGKLQLAELELLSVRGESMPAQADAAAETHGQPCGCSVAAPGSRAGVPLLLLALLLLGRSRKRH